MRTALLPPLLLLGLALGAPARAQGILNVERFQPQDVRGAHAAAEGSAALMRGNTNVVDVGLTSIVGYRGPQHWVRLLGGAQYLARGSSGIIDNRFVHLRYSYLVSPRLQTFHFAQVQANEAQALSRRDLLGSGLRATVLRSERASLDVGGGAMLERERLEPRGTALGERRRGAVRMANQLVYRHEIAPRVTALGVGYYQPKLTDPADFRVLNDLNLVVGLSRAARLTVSQQWRHDSRPPEGVQPYDFALRTSFGLSFE
jgi:hypothetical protein